MGTNVVHDPAHKVTIPTRLEIHANTAKTFTLCPLAASGAPVNMDGLALRFVVWEDVYGVGYMDINEGTTLTHTTYEATLFIHSNAFAEARYDLDWALLDVTTTGHERVIAWGKLLILSAINTM